MHKNGLYRFFFKKKKISMQWTKLHFCYCFLAGFPNLVGGPVHYHFFENGEFSGIEESDEDIPRTSTVCKINSRFVQPVKIYNKMEVSIDRARARYMNPPLRYGILKTMVF